MLVAVVADTHMPRGTRRLPLACVETIAGSDVAIHLGDFTSAATLAEFEAIGPPIHAVHGNADSPDVRRLLPAERVLDLAGRRVAIIHDAGPARGRLVRLRRRFPDVEAVLFGHSHLPLHEEDGRFQIFNPGSPTERRRAPNRSMGLMRASSEGLSLEHIALG